MLLDLYIELTIVHCSVKVLAHCSCLLHIGIGW